MKKPLLIILAILILSFASSIVRTQEIKFGKVIGMDDEKRVVTIDLGTKDGITVGTVFVLHDDKDMYIGCILVSEVSEETFTSDLIPADIYGKIKTGSEAEELGSGCRVEGVILKYIPEGYFGMGDNKMANEMPMHGVFLDEYYIDQYEVTNEEYKTFLNRKGRTAPYFNSKEAEPYNWSEGTYPEGKGKHPVVLVTYADAKDYCEYVGKRLPTEAEWEKAARGIGNRIWPWGNVWDGTKLNSKESGKGGTRIIGSFPDDLSPYDVFDMGGNVSEWTSSEYKPYKDNYRSDENYGKGFKVIRGGSWDSEKTDTRAASRSFADPKTKSIHTGFRCVKDIKE